MHSKLTLNLLRACAQSLQPPPGSTQVVTDLKGLVSSSDEHSDRQLIADYLIDKYLFGYLG